MRKMEEEGRQELIRRLETTSASVNVSPNATGQDQAALLQAMQQQQQQVLAHLRTQPVTGRLVVNVTSDIAEWENTPNDITLRAGDVITVPKRPNFVLAYGQVYNANAITYSPGKTADWHMRQAGGATELANKKDIYIIRANGSVISYKRKPMAGSLAACSAPRCSPGMCWSFRRSSSPALRLGRRRCKWRS